MSDSLTAQGDNYHSTEAYCEEWQRRMFLAEPEIPEEIEDLLWLKRMRISPSNLPDPMYACHDADVIEAYRRGCNCSTKGSSL